MSIDLTLRTEKGSALTYAELDDNFTNLKNGVEAFGQEGGAALVNFGTVDGVENATGADVAETVNALVDKVGGTGELISAERIKLQSDQYWLKTGPSMWDSGNSMVRDASLSSNGGKLGANLTPTQLLANAGFLSTVDPATGVTDSGIRFPPLQYDYAGGESIVVFWKGQITPEGSNQVFLGDTVSTTTQGIAFRVNTDGTCTFFIGNASGGLFSGGSSKVIFDGTTHSFAFVLDAVNKTQHWYVDGEPVTEKPFAFSAGTVKDSRAKTTFNLGSCSPAPGTTAGIATKTQSIHIFKKYGSVDKACVYQILNQLHINSDSSVSREF